MKKTFALILFFVSLTSYSQLGGGILGGWYAGSIHMYTKPYNSYSCYSIGFFLDYKVKSWFYWETGISYAKQGQNEPKFINGLYGTIREDDIDLYLHYLNVPILAKFIF